jgi:uncharacterized membrane protein YheB (UPF0754 family)
MKWYWIITPLVGAVIGIVTNDIAIRMLFRPRRPLYIGKWHIPLTPGLIPKGRERISSAIRNLLDEELLNADVLREALLSEGTFEKIEALADHTMDQLLQERQTPRMWLASLVGDGTFASFESQTKRGVTLFVMEKILESRIEQHAAEAAIRDIKARVKATAAAPLALLMDEKRMTSMEEKLSQTIREMIASYVPDALFQMLENIAQDALDTPIGELLSQFDDKRESVRSFLMDQYTALIQNALPGILNTLDLGTIVEEKLNSLDNAELEKMVLELASQELRAIVWLGGLLGGLIGLLNALFY